MRFGPASRRGPLWRFDVKPARERAWQRQVREVRAFETQCVAVGEPAGACLGEYLLNSYLLNSPEVEQAFAALPHRRVRPSFASPFE